ncbi:MAG: hypothetical protein PHH82_04890 [Candidatus ainarchaeum sp.]|nr:hypothetical protein [Candidatus ainarchaeum sp.]
MQQQWCVYPKQAINLSGWGMPIGKPIDDFQIAKAVSRKAISEILLQKDSEIMELRRQVNSYKSEAITKFEKLESQMHTLNEQIGKIKDYRKNAALAIWDNPDDDWWAKCIPQKK